MMEVRSNDQVPRLSDRLQLPFLSCGTWAPTLLTRTEQISAVLVEHHLVSYVRRLEGVWASL